PDVALGQPAQLFQHGARIVARRFDKQRRIEPVRFVGVRHWPDVLDVDLRAELFMFAVGGPKLVELAAMPFALARLEPIAVGPGHVRGGAAGVAESAIVIGLPLAGLLPCPLNEQREEVGILTRRQLAETSQNWPFHLIFDFGFPIFDPGKMVMPSHSKIKNLKSKICQSLFLSVVGFTSKSFLSPRTRASVTMYFPFDSMSGRSNMMSVIVSSTMLRRPRAPVSRSLARQAISRSARDSNSSSAPSISKSF